MKLALIDYGIGNLRSVQKALEAVGAAVLLTDQPGEILTADKVVLPGVGAFQDGMQGLRDRELIPTLNDLVARNIPLLGICLGMQLFFDSSTEMGLTRGLGFITGQVAKFPDVRLKIPQTGWNQLERCASSVLLEGIPSGAYVYFNHSYYCKTAEPAETITRTDYGLSYASAVQKDRLYGVQFHPEKSQRIGLTLLKNFVERG